MWLKYDVDRSGTLDPSEIRVLISEVMDYNAVEKGRDDVTLEEATRFMGFLDHNGDGVIDENEFLLFIVNAMTMTIENRINFAHRSPMHAKVMVFCTNLTERSVNIQKAIEREIEMEMK